MIGQAKLQNTLEEMLDNFPRFSIVVGGVGKRTFAKLVAEKIGATYTECGISVDSVRGALDTAYRVKDKMLYVFPNIQKMSINAKNALLKVTEEPPQNAYFIITADTTERVLDTLLSRGVLFRLEPYTHKDLSDYVKANGITVKDADSFYSLCENPQDVKELADVDVKALTLYAIQMLTDVIQAKNGMMFKFIGEVKLKDDDKGYNPIFVMRVLRNYCYKQVCKTHEKKYLNALKVVQKCIDDLMVSSFNSVATLDTWVFDVRKAFKS